MTETKKYKLLKDIQGIMYAQDGNNINVYFKTGDVVYGAKPYYDSGLVYVNSTGVFDGKEPTLAIFLADLQETDEEVKENTGVNVLPPEEQENTETEDKYALPLFKLFIGGASLFTIGYFIGRLTTKK
jgi:hypothetical protein